VFEESVESTKQRLIEFSSNFLESKRKYNEIEIQKQNLIGSGFEFFYDQLRQENSQKAKEIQFLREENLRILSMLEYYQEKERFSQMNKVGDEAYDSERNASEIYEQEGLENLVHLNKLNSFNPRSPTYGVYSEFAMKRENGQGDLSPIVVDGNIYNGRFKKDQFSVIYENEESS
jgi:hypothetical protein